MFTNNRITSELNNQVLNLHPIDLCELLGRIILTLNNRQDKTFILELTAHLIEVE